MIKKGDLVTAVGPLREVADFLASADKEKMRLLNSLLDSADPVADAKLLASPRKATKVYKDSLEVTLNKEYVFEERKEYWIEVENAPSTKPRRRNSAVATNIQDSPPLPSPDSGSVESAANQSS